MKEQFYCDYCGEPHDIDKLAGEIATTDTEVIKFCELAKKEKV